MKLFTTAILFLFSSLVFALGGLGGSDGGGCGTGLGEDPSCYNGGGGNSVEGYENYNINQLTWLHIGAQTYHIVIYRSVRFPQAGSEVHNAQLYVGSDIDCGTQVLSQGALYCTYPIDLRGLTWNPQPLTVVVRGRMADGRWSPFSKPIHIEYQSDIPAPNLLPLTEALPQ